MFMHQPQIQHMTEVMRILRYLKGTSSRGILFRKNDHLDLLAYTEADWAWDQDDRKSMFGYFTLVGGNLFTWKSKKQNVVSLWSAEAEFRGIAEWITEVIWLKNSWVNYTSDRRRLVTCFVIIKQKSVSLKIRFNTIEPNMLRSIGTSLRRNLWRRL